MGKKNQDHKEKCTGILSALAILLVLLAPGAYLLGISYYQGTLEAYGIDYSSFPASTPELYVTAYDVIGQWLLEGAVRSLELLGSVFAPPRLLWLMLIFATLSAIVYGMLKPPTDREWLLKTRLGKACSRIASRLHWSRNPYTATIGVLGISSSIGLVLVGTLVMVAFLWVGIPKIAFLYARKVENEKISDFLTHGCYVNPKQPWSNCSTLYDGEGKEIVSGLLVVMSTERIAFFSHDGAVVRELPKGYTVKRVRYGAGTNIPR